MDPSITYGSYLAVDELLALQRPRSEGPEHDEMLFIVIHQVYELWFKQVLHEIDHVIALLDFQSFRSRLEAASGFQSDQFRQLGMFPASVASSSDRVGDSSTTRWKK